MKKNRRKPPINKSIPNNSKQVGEVMDNIPNSRGQSSTETIQSVEKGSDVRVPSSPGVHQSPTNMDNVARPFHQESGYSYPGFHYPFQEPSAAEVNQRSPYSSMNAQNPYQNHNEFMRKPAGRCVELSRKTSETSIELWMNLDGSGNVECATGIGFFDHMLASFARHGFFDLRLKVSGDLYVDSHHTIEDTGIVLGQAIREAIGSKKGIKRYGSVMLPMDEALILCALDLSGRPYLVYDVNLTADRVGYFDTEMVKEFFYALSYSAGMNLHLKQMSGSNQHHIIEGCFKAFAKALDEAVGYDNRIMDVLSTKGTL